MPQPDLSKLSRGHFAGYSFERLFRFLNKLGEKVNIKVSPAKSKREARVELELA